MILSKGTNACWASNSKLAVIRINKAISQGVIFQNSRSYLFNIQMLMNELKTTLSLKKYYSYFQTIRKNEVDKF